MKRLIILLMSALMLLSLVSCGGKTAEEPKDIDVYAEASAIKNQYSLTNGKYYSSQTQEEGKYLDEDLIRSYYGDATEMPNFDLVEAYAVYIDETRPLDPCEFGIFKMKEGADKEDFASFLQARIDMKLQTAANYPTMDTTALTTAKITIKGNYVWYCAVKGGNDNINSNLEGKL